MQKKLQRFIGLIFLFQIFTLSMSAQSWETVKKIGGSNFERSGGIARDNDGNTYLVGEFNGDINIGSVTLTSTNNTNAFLAKLDSNGNTLWAKDFSALGFNLFNLRYGVDVDDSGNVYFTGRFSSSATLNFGNGVSLSPNVGGSFSQTFIVKFDTNGQAQWARAMSSTTSLTSYERRIQVTGAGDIFISGSYNGTFSLNNSIIFSGFTTEKAFLLKLSTAGTVVWSQEVLPSAANLVFGREVIMLPDETSVYVIGSSSSSSCFGCPVPGLQDTRVFVAEYSTQTGLLENSLFTEPTANDVSNLNGAVSDSGDVFMTFTFDEKIKVNNQIYNTLSSADVAFVRMNKDFTWDFVRVSKFCLTLLLLVTLLYKDGKCYPWWRCY